MMFMMAQHVVMAVGLNTITADALSGTTTIQRLSNVTFSSPKGTGSAGSVTHTLHRIIAQHVCYSACKQQPIWHVKAETFTLYPHKITIKNGVFFIYKLPVFYLPAISIAKQTWSIASITYHPQWGMMLSKKTPLGRLGWSSKAGPYWQWASHGWLSGRASWAPWSHRYVGSLQAKIAVQDITLMTDDTWFSRNEHNRWQAPQWHDDHAWQSRWGRYQVHAWHITSHHAPSLQWRMAQYRSIDNIPDNVGTLSDVSWHPMYQKNQWTFDMLCQWNLLTQPNTLALQDHRWHMAPRLTWSRSWFTLEAMRASTVYDNHKVRHIWTWHAITTLPWKRFLVMLDWQETPFVPQNHLPQYDTQYVPYAWSVQANEWLGIDRIADVHRLMVQLHYQQGATHVSLTQPWWWKAPQLQPDHAIRTRHQPTVLTWQSAYGSAQWYHGDNSDGVFLTQASLHVQGYALTWPDHHMLGVAFQHDVPLGNLSTHLNHIVMNTQHAWTGYVVWSQHTDCTSFDMTVGTTIQPNDATLQPHWMVMAHMGITY
jgi:hypothetical protein